MFFYNVLKYYENRGLDKLLLIESPEKQMSYEYINTFLFLIHLKRNYILKYITIKDYKK